MTIDIASHIIPALNEVKTFGELTELCKFAMQQLPAQTLNDWVFTRYTRKMQPGSPQGVFNKHLVLNCQGLRGLHIAASVAVIDPADPGHILVGGARRCADDAWNRHIGRVLATLRMVKVPLATAVAWSMERAPWESNQRAISIDVMYWWSQHATDTPLWQCLASGAIPLLACPAAVAVARQAVRHLIMHTDGFDVHMGRGRHILQHQDNVLANTELATIIAVAAGNLPIVRTRTNDEIAVHIAKQRATATAKSRKRIAERSV